MQFKSKRPGITLVEVVTVLTIGSALMMTGVGMVHTAMQSHANLVRAQQHATDLQRLDERLRHDAHASVQLKLTDSEFLLSTSFSEPSADLGEQASGQIRYSLEDQQLIRSLATEDGPPAREVFPLSGRELSWKLEELHGQTYLAIEIHRVESQLLEYRLLAAIDQIPAGQPRDATPLLTSTEEPRHDR